MFVQLVVCQLTSDTILLQNFSTTLIQSYHQTVEEEARFEAGGRAAADRLEKHQIVEVHGEHTQRYRIVSIAINNPIATPVWWHGARMKRKCADAQ